MPALKQDGAQPAERPPDTALQWQQARRILAIRLDNLGDVLMTTPELREAEPGRHITLLAGTAGRVLAPYLPEVDAVICVACPWLPDEGVQPRGAGRHPGAIVRRALRRRRDLHGV